MEYKTTWVIVCLPFAHYYNTKEVVINGETETEYSVAMGCTNEKVLKSNCYETKELAERKIKELLQCQK